MDFNIKTSIVKLITDKPVRKTPYQVKGVFIRNFSKESIVPMLDGSNRDKFLYPRVQVKILDEKIYLIGVKEGRDPVISIANKIKKLDFGNITFEVKKFEILESNYEFILSNQLINYKFISPWVALNHMTGGKYKKLNEEEKRSYLNKLLGQNIVFIANEFNLSLEKAIYTRLDIMSLTPNRVDEKKWGSFEGSFKTNCVLPNYIGLGNGITRGFGTIYYDVESLPLKSDFDTTKDQQNKSDIFKSEEGLEVVDISDVPKPKRRKSRKNNKRKKIRNFKKFEKNQNKTKNKSRYKIRNRKNINVEKSGNVFSNNISNEDNIEEKNFNTEEHHKRQHKF